MKYIASVSNNQNNNSTELARTQEKSVSALFRKRAWKRNYKIAKKEDSFLGP